MFYRYLQEYQALGTAGGLYHFRDQILAGSPDYFFVMNADVCGDFPLNEMLEFHKTKPKETYCTILGTEVCLFDDSSYFNLTAIFSALFNKLNYRNDPKFSDR